MARLLERYETTNEHTAATLHAAGFVAVGAVEDIVTGEVIIQHEDDPLFAAKTLAIAADKLPPMPRRTLDAAREHVRGLSTAARLQRRQLSCDAAVADWRAVTTDAKRLGADRGDIDQRWGAAVAALDAGAVSAIGQECADYLTAVQVRRARTQRAIERLKEIQGNA